MTELKIPREVIEAVARAIHSNWCKSSWETSYEMDRVDSRIEARKAIETTFNVWPSARGNRDVEQFNLIGSHLLIPVEYE